MAANRMALARQARRSRRSAKDYRVFVEAALWLAGTGRPWRDLPPELGNGHSTSVRFARSRDAGVREQIARALAGERDLARVIIDSTHALIAGMPCAGLVAGKAYDAKALGLRSEGSGAQAVIAPRAARITPRHDDRCAYRARTLIERFFRRIKHCHRIAHATTRSRAATSHSCESLVQGSHIAACVRSWRCEHEKARGQQNCGTGSRSQGAPKRTQVNPCPCSKSRRLNQWRPSQKGFWMRFTDTITSPNRATGCACTKKYDQLKLNQLCPCSAGHRKRTAGCSRMRTS